MSKGALTRQMAEYLAALHYCGSVRGFRFGAKYDSTRKALIKRGLVTRHEVKGRVTWLLTEVGTEAARALPDPRRTVRDESIQKRLDDVRAGRW